MIEVVFFASIREALGKDRIQMDNREIETVQDLITRLAGQESGQGRDVLSGENLLVAVNQTMVDPTHPVAPGDEVAIFPPVTGG